MRIVEQRIFLKELFSNSLQLALKDAEKVLSLRTNSVRSYILRANTLFLVRSLSLIFYENTSHGILNSEESSFEMEAREV